MSTDEIKVGDRVTLGGPTATAYVVVAAGPEWCAIDYADRPTSSPGVVPTGDLRKLTLSPATVRRFADNLSQFDPSSADRQIAAHVERGDFTEADAERVSVATAFYRRFGWAA